MSAAQPVSVRVCTGRGMQQALVPEQHRTTPDGIFMLGTGRTRANSVNQSAALLISNGAPSITAGHYTSILSYSSTDHASVCGSTCSEIKLIELLFEDMDPSQTKYPPMKDLTVDNLTENVNLINSGCKDARLKYLIDALVKHVHDYARETRLSMTEWGTAIDFLTKVGQKCTDTRQVSARCELAEGHVYCC